METKHKEQEAGAGKQITSLEDVDFVPLLGRKRIPKLCLRGSWSYTTFRPNHTSHSFTLNQNKGDGYKKSKWNIEGFSSKYRTLDVALVRGVNRTCG